NPPTNPDSQTITMALTDAPVSMTDIASAQNWLNNWMTNNATGWAIEDYVDPDGQSYTDSLKSLAEAVSGAGGVVLGSNTKWNRWFRRSDLCSSDGWYFFHELSLI
ncbi:MAG: hypothetical protein FWH31_11460, partial [Streptococcaceae bacterium]|nr:hypothetical protein [Streptococcaceae bacterium]